MSHSWVVRQLLQPLLRQQAASGLQQGWLVGLGTQPQAAGAVTGQVRNLQTAGVLNRTQQGACSGQGTGFVSSSVAHRSGTVWSRLTGGIHSPGLQGAVRHTSGLAGVPPATVAKARRMSLWVGGLAGLFGSFVGVGGGVLISPVIANACRSLPQRVISGTSLAAVVAVGSASGWVYFQGGYVDLVSAMVVAAAAMFTSPLGAMATHKINSTQLRTALGYWLYLVSPLVPLKVLIFQHLDPEVLPTPVTTPATAQPPAPAITAATPAEPAMPAQTGAGVHSTAGAAGSVPAGMPQSGVLRALRPTDAVLAVVGGIAGFASGLLGVGGGTIVTPLLALLTGMPQTAVVGTSLAAMAIPATAGLIQHARLGNVDWVMAAGLVAGSFAGSVAGSNVALNMPPFVLEIAFAAGMAFLGHRTLSIVKQTAKTAASAAAK